MIAVNETLCGMRARGNLEGVEGKRVALNKRKWQKEEVAKGGSDKGRKWQNELHQMRESGKMGLAIKQEVVANKLHCQTKGSTK